MEIQKKKKKWSETAKKLVQISSNQFERKQVKAYQNRYFSSIYYTKPFVNYNI